ncbi:MAG: hypothetical protein ACI89X_004573 [Planctomycetota bacterium]|jgi:hypothetical protein
MGKQAQHSMRLAALVMASALSAQDRTLVKPKPREGNAVDVYVMAIDEARRSFKIKAPEMLNLPYEATEEGYRSEYWADKCIQAAVARSLFAQAARTNHCKFGILPSGSSQLTTISPVLYQLRTLVYAHGMQNTAKNPDTALSDAETLLHHARQLFAGPSTEALALGYVAEANALTLINKTFVAASRDAAAIKRLRKSIGLHHKLRVTRDQIVDTAFAETLQRLKVIPGIIDSKKARLRIIDRLGKILVVVRDPAHETIRHRTYTPRREAIKWSNELIKIKRPVPADNELRKAYEQSLKLPAVAGIEGLVLRHIKGQQQLDRLLAKLPK